MRYSDSIFGRLLKPISRRRFEASVERHGGDAYDKTFGSFDHLVTLVDAQLGGIGSLRALEAVGMRVRTTLITLVAVPADVGTAIHLTEAGRGGSTYRSRIQVSAISFCLCRAASVPAHNVRRQDRRTRSCRSRGHRAFP